MMDMDLELNESEMHLYSRQILLDGWDLEAQEKLKLANILIVGCGGLAVPPLSYWHAQVWVKLA